MQKHCLNLHCPISTTLLLSLYNARTIFLPISRRLQSPLHYRPQTTIPIRKVPSEDFPKEPLSPQYEDDPTNPYPSLEPIPKRRVPIRRVPSLPPLISPRYEDDSINSYPSLEPFPIRKVPSEDFPKEPLSPPYEVDSINSYPSLEPIPIRRISDLPPLELRYEDDDEINFNNIVEDRPRPSRRSTITAIEHKVFRRIFKTLPGSGADEQSGEDEEISEEQEGDDGEATLESIFNAAIKQEQKRSLKQSETGLESDAESEELDDSPYSAMTKESTTDSQPPRPLDTERFPPSLRKAAERANNALLYSRTSYWRTAYSQAQQKIRKAPFTPPLNEYESQVAKAREDDMLRIEDLLRYAQTDTEVWEILNTEVFALVETMKKQMKNDEKAQRAAARPQSKNTADGKPQKKQTSLSSPSIPALAVLQTNYASHCLQAMRLFRVHFPTSPYATALLPHIKRLGSISYILGTSTSLYNELLYIRWVHYTDLHGVADLIDEMIEQGIGVNYLTTRLLLDGDAYLRKARKSKVGSVPESFLSLRGVSEGWLKWRQVAMKVYRENELVEERRQEVEEVEAIERARAEAEAEDIAGSIAVV